jgi:DNA helicase-2/ATP-dependent DNA helicase PcrA
MGRFRRPRLEKAMVRGRAIAELTQRGCAAPEIAVLYRAGAIGLSLQTVLKELGVPFEVRGGAGLWQSVAAKLVIGALYYLRDGESSQAMGRLGSNQRGQILRQQLDQIRAALRHQFVASCTHVQRIVADAVPGRSPDREKAEWRAVVDAVVALALSCSSLDELETKSTEQSRSLRNPPQNAVVLSTIHSAKGLEWDTVFMIGMEDGVPPHTNSEDIEEERRVAYVGVTRARQRLGLTYSDERYGERLEPSRFLSEIAGRDRRSCIWTGPNAGGADDRLPLLNSDEREHKVGQGKNAAPYQQPDRNRDAAAVHPRKSARMQKRKSVKA